MSRLLFQSFFFTYLLPCGSRREGQRVGLGGSLHRAGGRTARRAVGCLDHFNGFGVAHLPQGLHQLFYCPPRDLRDRNEERGCLCVQSCAGTSRQAVNTTARPFPRDSRQPGRLLSGQRATQRYAVFESSFLFQLKDHSGNHGEALYSKQRRC